MARRKSTDPTLVALMDEQAKTIGDFDRWYARMKRAFSRMDKLKNKLSRLARRIEARQAESAGRSSS